MYDPKAGRWLSEDRIRFKAGDVNLYRYVGNSPTNYTDPSGQSPYSDFDSHAGSRGPDTPIDVDWYNDRYSVDLFENLILRGESQRDRALRLPRGCWGATSVRIGTDSLPHRAPGVVIFADPQDARNYRDQLEDQGKTPLLFAIQDVVPIGPLPPGVAPLGPGRIHPAQIPNADPNFATLLDGGGTDVWEYANHGYTGTDTPWWAGGPIGGDPQRNSACFFHSTRLPDGKPTLGYGVSPTRNTNIPLSNPGGSYRPHLLSPTRYRLVD
ncbi:MAG: hypothetical protein M3552_09005 [Planctomycetota bacterium]|nr:hypothetical protein [Planctomycetaceae bacterium]MDQ3330777.1 hypothetical protein [Planctomycetota bacterium]